MHIVIIVIPQAALYLSFNTQIQAEKYKEITKENHTQYKFGVL